MCRPCNFSCCVSRCSIARRGCSSCFSEDSLRHRRIPCFPNPQASKQAAQGAVAWSQAVSASFRPRLYQDKGSCVGFGGSCVSFFEVGDQQEHSGFKSILEPLDQRQTAYTHTLRNQSSKTNTLYTTYDDLWLHSRPKGHISASRGGAGVLLVS